MLLLGGVESLNRSKHVNSEGNHNVNTDHNSEEIEENEFNLNIPRYVDTFEPEP